MKPKTACIVKNKLREEQIKSFAMTIAEIFLTIK